MNTRVCITGAGGQVGLDLIRALRQCGAEVHAADLRCAPDAQAGAEDLAGVPWHHVDVTDARSALGLLDHVRPDAVFHLAAILSVGGESNPQAAYAVNQTGTYNVLEGCRKAGVRQMLFTSSIAAFGPGTGDAVADDAPTRPTTIYGITKVAGEMLGEYYHRRYRLDFRAVRFPGLLSASLPGGGTSDYALLMYVDALAKGSYTAYCRPDTRIPLMYMPDAVRALVELAQAPAEALSRRVYNIAAFSPTAQQIADSVTQAVPGARITFHPDPLRQAILDSWPRAMQDDNARRDWGWHPRFTLEQMTSDLVPRIRRRLSASPDTLKHTEDELRREAAAERGSAAPGLPPEHRAGKTDRAGSPRAAGT